MNKGDLVDAMARSTGLDKRQADKALNAFVQSVIASTKAGENVRILGFGTFVPTSRSARTGRNPRTGAPVKVAASRSVKFSPGSGFKSLLNTKGSSKKAPAVKAAAAKKAPAKKAPAKKAPAKTSTKKK